MKAALILAAVLAAAPLPAPAAVTAFLSNGKTCNGGAMATSTAVTPNFHVSVCVTTTTPWCGITYQFERIGSGGTLNVKSRTALGVATDLVSAPKFPFAIPPMGVVNHPDLGALRSPRGALDPGVRILVATYNISVLASKPATDYVFRLSTSSAIADDPLGSCGALKGGKGPDRFDPISLPADVPIAATFTLRKK